MATELTFRYTKGSTILPFRTCNQIARQACELDNKLYVIPILCEEKPTQKVVTEPEEVGINRI